MSSDSLPSRIGFVGLGVMGAPMAGHLVHAGYEVTVFDALPSAISEFVGAHSKARGSASPAGVALNADVVITMVPDGRVVQTVSFGPDGLLETMRPGSLLLDTSSSQPSLTVETAAAFAARGVAMVDAPVSGAQWGAQAADLVFMVGGTASDVARVQPILDVLGRAVHHVGPLGSGHTMKCINNIVTALTFVATSEGLALGARLGLDPGVMNSVLNESTGGSWITKNHIEQRILSRTFDDPFRLELMRKDVGIAAAVARSEGLDLPAFELADRLYGKAVAYAGAGVSLSELSRYVEGYVGAEIRPLQ
jgi:3-hydroxyisobutyrate dehydrogenase